MKTPDKVLEGLPDFQAWSSGKPRFDLIDYAMCTASADALCAFLELIDPALVKHDGHYYLEHQFDLQTYEAWRAKLSRPEDIQRVMNHIHVSALVQGQDVTDEVAVHIANGLATCWSRAFRHLGLKAESFGSCLDDAQVTLFTAEDCR